MTSAVDLDDIAGKIFIGGLSWSTTEQTLRNYFERYGELTDVALMIDKKTGKPRGFGFIKLKDSKDTDAVMADQHTIDGRQVEAKRALPRDKTPNMSSGRSESCKIFIGGLSPEITDKDFVDYFSKWGIVKDAVVMIDKNTYASRGFGFVTFELESSVDKVLREGHAIKGKYIECKRAEPKGFYGGGPSDGGFMGGRGMGGRDGGRGMGGMMDAYGGYGGGGAYGGGNRYPNNIPSGYGGATAYNRPGYTNPVPNAGYGGYPNGGQGGDMGYYGGGQASYGGGAAGGYGGATVYGGSGGGPGNRGLGDNPSDYGMMGGGQADYRAGGIPAGYDNSAIAGYNNAAMQQQQLRNQQQQQHYGYGTQVPSGAAANSGYGGATPATATATGVANPRMNYAADSTYPAVVDQQNYGAYKGGSGGSHGRADRSYRPY